jgi:NADH-quinone oxidoreductase subunit M
MLGIVLTLAYLFKMMRGLFYGPMNQKYSHAHDAISTVDRLPLLIMIAVSVGFGIFPMHLYDVVRSGVDPLVAKITRVVPVAETGEELDVRGKPTAALRPPEVPLIVNNPVPLTSDLLRRSE